MARRLQPSPTQPQGGPLGKGAAPSSLAIPLWRACQSLPTGFSGPSFVTEWNEDSKRALGFELGGKRGSDDGKAVLVGFRDDPPLADGSLGVEPDRHGALRHVLRPYSLRAPGCLLLAPRVTKKNSPQRCALSSTVANAACPSDYTSHGPICAFDANLPADGGGRRATAQILPAQVASAWMRRRGSKFHSGSAEHRMARVASRSCSPTAGSGRVLRQTAPVSCDRPQCLHPASRNIEHPLKKILLYRPCNQFTDELANPHIS